MASPEGFGSSSSASVRDAARDSIEGRTRGLRALLPFLGPAFIASVAYIDPGNFATNISGGAQFGYNLLWVILLANVMAMLLQSLSAKLGIATGLNLAEMCRREFPRPVVYGMWIIAEVGAMATDLAEFLGAAVGFNLLFGMPLLAAGILTGLCTFAILSLERYGFRLLEAVITVLVAVIAVSYVVETVLARPDWGQVAYHAFVPWVSGDSALLIVGIIGATVMPHVIYLHSSLTQRRIVPRDEGEARRIFGFEIVDVIIAMSLAGIINMAMLYMAASVFHGSGYDEVGSIEQAYLTLTPLLGGLASTVFAISLLASGLSSSTVGTMAGQVIMQGFVDFSIPIWLRRLVTMLPAIVIIALGWNPTEVLVISQVTLSFVLPIPVISLVLLTRRRDLMGSLVNRPITNVLAMACAAIILLLNALLIYITLGGILPGASS
ncbi:MAG: divalent metal cation transporter [Chloroflexota bacterium]|nr:MAG: divalent metal cation transporter [Chloroflexota bacterium]